MATFILIIFFQHLEVLTIRSSKDSITAQKNDYVTVHYQGLINDSTEFENSFVTNKPISFYLGTGKVIKGWDSGLQGMKIGEVRKLVIPPHLAYGDRKIGPIPANSELTFIVELLEVKKAVKAWQVTDKHEAIYLSNSHYYDFEIGNGTEVTKGKKVKYHYNLFNIDGNKVYSTRDQNDIKELKAGSGKHMIKGFEDALLGMKPGGKRKIICKDDFGKKGDLYIFDLSLISVD